MAQGNSRGVEVKRWCALVDRPLTRDGESGIIGIQNLYYATWFTKLIIYKNTILTNCHFYAPKIHFFSTELLLCREYSLPLGGLPKDAIFEHYSNDKKQYLFAEKKK